MNHMKTLLKGILSALALALFAIVNTSYAEESSITEASYINGGFGQEESDDMRAKAGEYNLRLYFSDGKLGHSITDVSVTITDKNGNVSLSTLTGGPMLFLLMEKGAYKITAQYNGVTLIKKVSVINQRGVNVYLNWKNTAVDTEDIESKED